LAKTVIDPKKLPSVQWGSAGILYSKWYPERVQVMLSKCAELLKRKGFTDIESHQVPGALELPYACQELIISKIDEEEIFDVLICLAIVIRGETDHYEVIRDTVPPWLMQLSVEFHIPIINEILFVDNMALAEARSVDEAGYSSANKGAEAAAAAIEITYWSHAINEV